MIVARRVNAALRNENHNCLSDLDDTITSSEVSPSDPSSHAVLKKLPKNEYVFFDGDTDIDLFQQKKCVEYSAFNFSFLPLDTPCSIH